MGRAPCCDKANVKKGPWSPEEDAKLKEYIEEHGTGGNWISLPQKAGLKRCGKSCRLRWLNYLRPNIKHGEFSDEEDRIICSLFASIGSRWSIIAAQLPGRTDNDIKNYWNTKLKKKLMGTVNNPSHRKPYQAATTAFNFSSLLQSSPSSAAAAISYNNSYNYTNTAVRFEPNASFSNSLLSRSSNSCITAATNPILQPQESRWLGPMQHSYQVKDNVLMFGGETAASCSSSDGSCSNQISHGKDLEYHDFGGRNTNSGQMGFQNCNWIHEENQNFMISNVDSSHWCEQKPSLCFGENPLDYGLEEIKRLISSSTGSCNNINLFDENKTEEKVMMFY